jgi:hypothetical protein
MAISMMQVIERRATKRFKALQVKRRLDTLDRLFHAHVSRPESSKGNVMRMGWV